MAAPTNFSDLNAVGFFWQRVADGNGYNIDISQFIATPTAIPEPSTALLLAAGGSIFVLGARARNGRRTRG